MFPPSSKSFSHAKGDKSTISMAKTTREKKGRRNKEI